MQNANPHPHSTTHNTPPRFARFAASSKPYHTAVGNHESECHDAVCITEKKKYGLPLSNFTAYNARWHMPSAESGGRASMWYSYNYGPVHFLILNTETDFPGAGEEKTGDSGDKKMPAGGFGQAGELQAWVASDLAAADASRKAGGSRPWLVVAGHRTYDEVYGTFGSLFEQYGVDAYFAGHVHSYSRTPANAQKGLVNWIVAGGAGCEEMGPPAASKLLGPKGVDSVENYNYATGILEATKSALRWKLIDSITGETLDQFELAA